LKHEIKYDKNFSRRVAVVGITAALYFVLTFALGSLAFREIQFRVSEVLCLLVFINPIFAPGVILGCFISNLLLSPIMIPDIIFGTLHTAISMWLITRTKRLEIAALIPVLFCFIIGAELVIFIPEIPKTAFSFLSTTFTVMLGEAAVLLLVGLPVFKFGVLRNAMLTEFLKSI
jgi:uncharacterized membrane protein